MFQFSTHVQLLKFYLYKLCCESYVPKPWGCLAFQQLQIALCIKLGCREWCWSPIWGLTCEFDCSMENLGALATVYQQQCHTVLCLIENASNLWLAQWGVNIFLPHIEWPEKFWPVYKSRPVFWSDFQGLIGRLINWKISYYFVTFLTVCNSGVFCFVMPIRLKVA